MPGSSAPFWDFRRSTLAARELTLHGESLGLTFEQCVAGSDVTRAQIEDVTQEIDARQELAITRNLIRHLGDRPGLGADVGLRFSLSSFGLLGFVMLTSATLREALVSGLRFIELSNAFVSLLLTETPDGGGYLTVDDSDIPSDVRDFILERDFAALWSIFSGFFSGDLANPVPVVLKLRLDGSRGNELAAKLPHTVVLLDQPDNRIDFPSGSFDLPLPQANAATARMCEQQCLDLLAHRKIREGTSGQVRALLLRDPAAIPDAETIAAELSMCRRTLHRWLATENTSYRALVEEVRQTLACELLDSGMTVEQVSRRLGYAKPSSLTHAFIRWQGFPPSQYRARSR
jgi:AraC-like DNA-binding protein